MPPLSLMIFRRDLRLQDNPALNHALSFPDRILPIFIFDPRQCDPHPYRGAYALQFLIECLEELQESFLRIGGRLVLLSGKAEDVVAQLIEHLPLQRIFFNEDYTPFSRGRDENISRICQERGVECHLSSGLVLFAPGTIVKENNDPYTVYTPFSKRAAQTFVREVSTDIRLLNKADQSPFFTDSLSFEIFSSFYEQLLPQRKPLPYQGGRGSAMSLLQRIETFRDYGEKRDIPAQNGTTHLSPHHKFGTLSPQETFHAVRSLFGSEHPLIKELYWREFFTHISFFFPHVYRGAFHKKYQGLEWSKDKSLFDRWAGGTTGFPIVDAGMRELQETGFMHNRVRMIVGSFLTKDLHISWRWGERFFAQQLVDYDPAVNNGNWQWVASTGCDAQPYFRIFNPWLQEKRFDPECLYIKRWIPELSDSSAKQIHGLVSGEKIGTYPTPMIDHASEKKIAERMFANVA